MTYAIKNWRGTFENNRSREVKNPSWVAMPNRHDTLGFRTLISLPNGMALYGAWCVLVQVASRCQHRGVLTRNDGQPHTPYSLSIKTGVPEDLIAECLSALQNPQIGWIEAQEGETTLRQGCDDTATPPQEGATTLRLVCAKNERNERNERNGTGQKETNTVRTFVGGEFSPELQNHVRSSLMEFPGVGGIRGKPDANIVKRCLLLTNGDWPPLRDALVLMAKSRSRPSKSWAWFPAVIEKVLAEGGDNHAKSL